jgi:flagellar biosynthesis protein FlhF
MRLKLFNAATMAEAMAQIRAELGSDAIILEQRRTRHGVEITAALEPEEPLLIQPLNSAPAFVPSGPLDFHNIPSSLAVPLGRGSLPESLAEALTFTALPQGRERPLLLAGPPGAGKTLTTAKLTARMVMGGTAPMGSVPVRWNNSPPLRGFWGSLWRWRLRRPCLPRRFRTAALANLC